MIELTHRSTGHTVRTDEASVDFWLGAGYEKAAKESPARKVAAKKAAPKKSE